MRGLFTVRFDLVKHSPLLGEDLPFIQALNNDRFIIEGQETAFSGLIQWLEAEYASVRFRKVRLRPDPAVDLNKLAGKLRESGVRLICLSE